MWSEILSRYPTVDDCSYLKMIILNTVKTVFKSLVVVLDLGKPFPLYIFYHL